jgi:hypothetical protein
MWFAFIASLLSALLPAQVGRTPRLGIPKGEVPHDISRKVVPPRIEK